MRFFYDFSLSNGTIAFNVSCFNDAKLTYLGFMILKHRAP